MVHCCIIVHGKHSSSCFKMFQKSEQQQVIDISLVINYQHLDSADNNLNDLINIQLKLVWIELVRAMVSWRVSYVRGKMSRKWPKGR